MVRWRQKQYTDEINDQRTPEDNIIRLYSDHNMHIEEDVAERFA